MISPLWLDFLVELDKESRKVLLPMDFSIAKTKYPDTMFHKTEQMAKNLSKLYLALGMYSNCDASHHGLTLMSIASLAADAHREHEQDEMLRAMTTSTVVADYLK